MKAAFLAVLVIGAFSSFMAHANSAEQITKTHCAVISDRGQQAELSVKEVGTTTLELYTESESPAQRIVQDAGLRLLNVAIRFDSSVPQIQVLTYTVIATENGISQVPVDSLSAAFPGYFEYARQVSYAKGIGFTLTCVME